MQKILLIVLSVAAGLSAGIFASVWSAEYLDRYAASLEGAGNEVIRLSQEKPQPIPGTFEEAAARARDVVQPALVRFQRVGGIDPILLPGEEDSLGVVITSDGWVMTSVETAEGDAPLHAFIGETEYTIVDSVSDPYTEIYFYRLEASGLPVIPFGASDQVESGSLAFAATSASALLPTAVVDAHHWNATVARLPAETFTRSFTYADLFPLPGTPVVNSAGELIAIDGTPLHQLLPVVRSVIRSGESARTVFGATVIDLSAVHVPAGIDRGFSRGTYIDTVVVNGPAAIAGVRRGDIITHVGGMALGDESFAERLLSYAPEETVRLTIDRGGEEVMIDVQLGRR